MGEKPPIYPQPLFHTLLDLASERFVQILVLFIFVIFFSDVVFLLCYKPFPIKKFTLTQILFRFISL